MKKILQVLKFLKSLFKKDEWHIEPCGLRTVQPDVHAFEMGEDYPIYISKLLIDLHSKLHL